LTYLTHSAWISVRSPLDATTCCVVAKFLLRRFSYILNDMPHWTVALLGATFERRRIRDEGRGRVIRSVALSLRQRCGIQWVFRCDNATQRTNRDRSFHYQIIHTYHSRFIPEEVAKASRLFLPDAHVLPKLLCYEEYCRHGRW
jgi:hypothetical protein